MPTITIIELEQAINDCKQVHPPIDYELGEDLRAMAALWGDMIYRRLCSVEPQSLTPALRVVLARWLRPAEGATDARE